MTAPRSFSGPSPRVRVLMVGPLPPPLGGMTTFMVNYLASPITQRYHVEVLRTDLVAKYRFKGIVRKAMNLVNLTVLLAGFLLRVARHRPHIVHVQTNSFGGYFEKALLCLAARLCGRRVVLNVHGGGFREFYEGSAGPIRWLIRRSLHVNHRIIAASRSMAKTLEDIGVDPARLLSIKNAVFVPRESVWETRPKLQPDAGSPPHRELTVLFLNRPTREKGLFEFVSAARALATEDARLRFSIVGPLSPEAESLRRGLGGTALEKAIRFHGSVSDARKIEFYRAADLYVLPSYVEDLPYGLLEAASHGLPILASPVGGIPDIIRDGVSGRLVPPGDETALAGAMRELLGDEEARRRMGAEARALIQREYDMAAFAEDISRLYASLAGGRGRGGPHPI